MTNLAPEVEIARVHSTWHIQPDMMIAVVEDERQRLWIAESCPVGTQFWTPDQAAGLKLGVRTNRLLKAAVRTARSRVGVRSGRKPYGLRS